MTPITLLKYLIGDRAAIRAIASSRGALWLGLLFVLSAGFAREYDGEDLLAEPWHLLIPVAASLATSFLLFSLLWINCREEFHCRREEFGKDKPSFQLAYRSFLSLYWMTAPLAWLYAIPVERFLSPGGATSANLWLLGVVALWRVVLMIRVASVMFNEPMRAAVGPVMLFADSVALAILLFTPLPVISIMGGVRLTESELMIRETANTIAVVGILSFPLWLLLTVLRRRFKPVNPAFYSSDASRSVSAATWGVAALSLLVWIPILPVTQREQQLRRQVEVDLQAGRIESALQTMSAHSRDDFPPHWDPPPRIGYGESHPPLEDVLKALSETDASPWVRAMFQEKWESTRGRAAGSPPPEPDEDDAPNETPARTPDESEDKPQQSKPAEATE